MAKGNSYLASTSSVRITEDTSSKKAIYTEISIIYEVLLTLFLFVSGFVVKSTGYPKIYSFFWWLVSVSMLSGAYIRFFLLGHEMFHIGDLRLQKMKFKILRYIVGTVTLSPIVALKKSHQIHHNFNCNWSIYKGPMLIVEEKEFKRMKGWQRIAYWLTRRVELVWLTGLIAHVVVPRVRLMKLLCKERMGQREESRGILWDSQVRNGLLLDISTMEVIDTLAVTVGSLVLFWILHKIDAGLVIVYTISVLCGQSVIILIIHMQHTFPGSYAASLDAWDRRRLVDGTANMSLGWIGNWLTANFAVYHVQHHMKEAVAWRNLTSIEIERGRIKELRFSINTVYECFGLLIWSKERKTFCKLEEIS